MVSLYTVLAGFLIKLSDAFLVSSICQYTALSCPICDIADDSVVLGASRYEIEESACLVRGAVMHGWSGLTNNVYVVRIKAVE